MIFIKRHTLHLLIIHIKIGKLLRLTDFYGQLLINQERGNTTIIVLCV